MSFDTENGGIVALNVLPRTLTATTLKIWQRYAATAAAVEVIERQRYVTLNAFTIILLFSEHL